MTTFMYFCMTVSYACVMVVHVGINFFTCVCVCVCGVSSCEPCGCDGRGSTSNTCNSNGTCLCKEHVTGVKCELCKLNTLGLSADNPSGCAEGMYTKLQLQCV